MMFYNNILKHHWFPLLSSSELHKNKIINKQFFNKDIYVQYNIVLCVYSIKYYASIRI